MSGAHDPLASGPHIEWPGLEQREITQASRWLNRGLPPQRVCLPGPLGTPPPRAGEPFDI